MKHTPAENCHTCTFCFESKIPVLTNNPIISMAGLLSRPGWASSPSSFTAGLCTRRLKVVSTFNIAPYHIPKQPSHSNRRTLLTTTPRPVARIPDMETIKVGSPELLLILPLLVIDLAQPTRTPSRKISAVPSPNSAQLSSP